MQATVSKLPPHVRGTMGRSSAASSAVVADCDSGPSSATSPEEQDYIQSMKALQFRMVRIDHATHTYVPTCALDPHTVFTCLPHLPLIPPKIFE